MSELLVSVSGVRGVVGKALTAQVALNYAASFGAFLKGGTVVIGRDTRKSGLMIESAVVAGLTSVGCNVIKIGVCPTPTVELAVDTGRFDGGIAVTASHNPPEYNALKLIGQGGLFLSEKQGNKVNEIYNNGSWKNKEWEKLGHISYDTTWIEKHINKILSLKIISVPKIKKQKLKIVADCVDAAATAMADQFFAKLGVKYKLIHNKPAGDFPRGPEPVPENLSDLCRAVKRFKADVGFAFDPDADRLAIVSEKGIPLGEEYTLALGARYILSKKKSSMAVNLSSSMMNEFVAEEAGVKLYRTKVGERNVTEKLIRTRGIVGGEGNGGLIYTDLLKGRDAFGAAAVITQYLAESQKTISQLAGELPAYVMLKTKMKLNRRQVQGKIKALKRGFPDGVSDESDGLRISGRDWWVQIRASNTEPIARLMVEAVDKKIARKLLAAAKSVLRK